MVPLALALLGGAPAWADAIADADAAFQRSDFPAAAALYRVAASEGDPDAQMLLAFMYHDGQGVPKDLVRAYMWFAVAETIFDPTTQDFMDAGAARDITTKSMTPAQIDQAHAMAKACLARNYKNCD